jgi:uncharacterized protein (TIGR02453 family)
MSSPFTPRTVSFLRALKRNNHRDWFRERKADYETHVREPMVAVIERLAADFSRIAPDMIAEPRVSLFRIYRDTRFSADKTPLKTNAAAHFPSRRFPRGEGAGLYFEIAPGHVWIGGGSYMPTRDELRGIRDRIAAQPRTLRRIVTSPAFRDTFGALEGERLSRVPRGYVSDHPAADHLRHKQFFAGREYPAAFACDARFYPELLRVFRTALPLVRFLNTAMLDPGRRPPVLL